MKNLLRSKFHFLVLIAGLALAVGGCDKHEEAATPDMPGPQVNGQEVVFPDHSPQLDSLVVEPARARTVAVKHVTGRLYWDDDVTVRIFTPVFGRVTKVLADVGDAVETNSPLAELDSPDYAQALANARTAVGNLMAADKSLQRTRELLAHGAYAQKDLESAEAVYIAALAERDRARAVLMNYGGGDRIYSELERAMAAEHAEASAQNYAGTNDTLSSRYVVRSPLAGVVVDKSINPGQELRPDLQLANDPTITLPLFTVSDPTILWLQVDVAEADLASLEVGQPLHVYSPAYPDRVFNGVVEKISDALDPATRTLKIRGAVANPGKLLKAEMYVTVDVVQAVDKLAQAGVEIPASAVFLIDGTTYLFVQTAPGHFTRQAVQVGPEEDGQIPVFSGLSAGQNVVTEGALLLQSILNPAG
jgi:cobalt-zinc-cadmium efflux system membrane fusion protein